MSEISELKRLANKANAQKSTGPRSVDGKNRSRGNALKHGLCSIVVDLPDEDPQVVEDRFDDWNAELNPKNLAAQSFLVLQAVRRSRRLDRLDTSHEARVAKSVRDAHKDDHEQKLCQIDDLKSMLLTDQCAIAVRRLMTTLEGCEHLIHEWTCLRPTLEPLLEFGVPPWDNTDLTRINQLTSNDSIIKRVAPSIYVLPSIAIRLHREVVIRMKQNEIPDKAPYELRYNTTSEKIRDERDCPGLYAEAEPARLGLIKVFDEHLAMLTDLKHKLEVEAAKHRDEVPYRALFDSSDQGKLIHRYEMENERSLMRCFKELRELNKADANPTQIVYEEDIMDNSAPPAPPRSTPPPARNEPTEPGRFSFIEGLKPASERPQIDVPINITPPDWAKRKQ